MSGVRVLVGTRKGAFVLTSDGKRKRWGIGGPHFAGWEVYHVKGSPADPDRLYASQTSGWFGQIIQRSNDGGKTWEQPGIKPGEPTTTPAGMPISESNKFVYDTSPRSGNDGRSAAPISRAGRSIISRDRRPIRTGSTHRRRAPGSDRSSSAPTTAAKPGSSPGQSPAN